jgi:hypothetical protein
MKDSAKLKLQLKKAKDALGKIKTIRNKSICHNDCAPGAASVSESFVTVKAGIDEAKALFQMCCGSAHHHRFTPNVYPERMLKQWLSCDMTHP